MIHMGNAGRVKAQSRSWTIFEAGWVVRVQSGLKGVPEISEEFDAVHSLY